MRRICVVGFPRTLANVLVATLASACFASCGGGGGGSGGSGDGGGPGIGTLYVTVGSPIHMAFPAEIEVRTGTLWWCRVQVWVNALPFDTYAMVPGAPLSLTLVGGDPEASLLGNTNGAIGDDGHTADLTNLSIDRPGIYRLRVQMGGLFDESPAFEISP
jgi:hypothetical protein